jgi:hypothetical protein
MKRASFIELSEDPARWWVSVLSRALTVSTVSTPLISDLTLSDCVRRILQLVLRDANWRTLAPILIVQNVRQSEKRGELRHHFDYLNEGQRKGFQIFSDVV